MKSDLIRSDLQKPLFIASVILFAGSFLVLFFFSLYLAFQSNVQNKQINLKNENLVLAAKAVLNNHMRYLSFDLRFLADLAQKNYSARKNRFDLKSIQTVFQTYAVHEPSIDQVRILSPQGREWLRINRKGSQMLVTPKGELQDKHDRYYFSDAISLPENGIAISRLDLNVENHQIEFPLKPTLRLATPLYGENEKLRGVLVINFLAQELIGQLRALRKEPHQHLWFLDERLDWVVAPKGHMPWASQLEIKQSSLVDFLPEVARKIQQEPTFSGVFDTNRQDFFISKTGFLPPKSLKAFPYISRAKDLYLMSAYPKAQYSLNSLLSHPSMRNLMFQIIGLLFLIAFFIGVEVHRREKLAKKNQFQKNQIKSFFNHAPEAMLISGEDGQLIYQNEKARMILSQADPVKDGLGIQSERERADLWRQLTLKGEEESDVIVELEGKKLYFVRQSFLIEGTEGDRLMAVILADLTELKTTQYQLMEKEARIRHLIDAAPDAILLSNGKGEILMSNRKAQKMFELSQEAFLNTSIESLVPHPYRGAHKAMREAFHAAPRHRMMSENPNILAQSASGRKFYVEISLSPTVQEGETLVISIIRDVTDRKRIENQLKQNQKMEALGQLTGGIAHDFNNMLTLIIGNLDLVKASLMQNPPQLGIAKEKLDIGLNSALKATKLTKRLLAFARKQPMSTEVVQIGHLIRDEFSILEAASGKMTEISLHIDEGLWLTRVNIEELTAALINLSTNAKDAMPEGGKILITVQNYRVERNSLEILGEEIPAGEYVSIDFSDNGCGVPAEYLDKILEPFFSTKPKNEGTGLGLSMLFGFVKQSNGYLKIYSEEGLGTSVKMLLPRYHGEDGTAISSKPAQNPWKEEALGGSGTILLVDDDLELLVLGRQYLEDAGYHILTASNAEEALSFLGEWHIDLVLTDIVMSGRNGFELAQAIHERAPDLKVIFCSGFPEEALKESKKIREEIILLDKPYRRNELLQVVSVQMAELSEQ